jgi:hypothetical protein
MNWRRIWKVALGVWWSGAWAVFTTTVCANTIHVLNEPAGLPSDFVVLRDAMAILGFGLAGRWLWVWGTTSDHTPNEKG